MRKCTTACLLIVAGAAIAVLFSAQSPAAPPARVASSRMRLTTNAQAGAPKLKWLGRGSCASSKCHGETNKQNQFHVWQNEIVIWKDEDSHSQAYQVLTDDDRSKQMVKLLKRPKPAEQLQECLVCHAPSGNPAMLVEGVGCESCHGPAERWKGPHSEPSWKDKPPAEKALLGMTNTKDLGVRAAICAKCHIGTPAKDGEPARDVNHDLIAAGHPRLDYEFSDYLARMPKHWSEEARQPDNRSSKKRRNAAKLDAAFDARAWAVGKAVSARIALELLSDRAEDADKWPELAEYDCFACHHDLADPSWRQDMVYSPGEQGLVQPGQPRWGDWYFAGINALLKTVPGAPPDIEAPLAELTQMLSSFSDERQKIAKNATRIGKSFDAWSKDLSKTRFDKGQIAELTSTLLADADKFATANWDGARQLYVAMLALRQARLGVDGKRLTAEDPLFPVLKEWRDKLALSGNDPEADSKFDSPRGLRPPSLAEDLNRLDEILGNP